MSNKKSAAAATLGILLLLSSLAEVSLGYETDPYLKSTRTQLMKARAVLIAGEDDKDGHRAKAMAYTFAAIDEVEAAMKSRAHHARLQTGETFATSIAATPAGSNMRKALIHLKQAKENLGAATPDAGGHHAKATELIDKAIVEVEKANAASA
ncbi:MAG: hypothetical protein H7Z16_17820 [Pyrinomonadaceae bacterium]|nr:hypothetical protein [Pyrinomonadaceae bacterium]